MLEIIIILSLINAALIFCLYKWKVIEWLETYVFGEALCVFCFGFWLAMFGTIIVGCFMLYPWYFIFIPFACAPVQLVVLKKMWE